VFQVPLAEVEEERKAQRDAHQQRGGENDPTAVKAEAVRLQGRKSQKDQGGYDHIQREKGADAIGEEVLQEKASVGAVFGEPGKERGVRRGKADNAQKQIDRFGFHLLDPPFADS
jgi:hypothetical protein